MFPGPMPCADAHPAGSLADGEETLAEKRRQLCHILDVHYYITLTKLLIAQYMFVPDVAAPSHDAWG